MKNQDVLQLNYMPIMRSGVRRPWGIADNVGDIVDAFDQCCHHAGSLAAFVAQVTTCQPSIADQGYVDQTPSSRLGPGEGVILGAGLLSGGVAASAGLAKAAIPLAWPSLV